MSLGDWADGEAPDAWRDELFDVIAKTSWLDWLLLTKRPRMAARYISRNAVATKAATQNVWMGISAGVDPSPIFDIPSRCRFLSCEPMLEPLAETHADKFNWIIFGFESGKNARIGKDEWIRSGITFCRRHRISVFVKQLGTNPARFKHSHGGDPSEWPQDLRIREFPEPRTLNS